MMLSALTFRIPGGRSRRPWMQLPLFGWDEMGFGWDEGVWA